MHFDLTAPPKGLTDNPYPVYQNLLEQAPVLKQADGSYVISSYALLDRIYKDTKQFSSDKQAIFGPKYGDSPLFEHHTTSLVFNDPPLHTRVRKVLAGAMTPIDAGTNLHLVIGAANRDPQTFTNPNTLDVARQPNKHLAFAGGPHACIGLNLARMEGRIAIGRFVKRFPNYTVLSNQRSSRLRFRGFTHLNVRL